MKTVDEYKRLHAQWMMDRVDRYGALPQDEEAAWAEKLDAVWRELTAEQHETLETWLKAQQEYRRQNDIPLSGDRFEMTPEEDAQIISKCECESIVSEDDHNVVFLVNGKEISISRGVLLDYDRKGHFWVARTDAEKMGLLQ